VFDVSFSELLVIAVIALLVIGPEKLPKVARTLGALTGRLQRYVAQVKEEVNREVRFEELQELQQEIKQGVQQVNSSFHSEVQHLVDMPKAKTERKTKTLAKTKSVKSLIEKKPRTKV